MKNTVFLGLLFLHLVCKVWPLENGLARTPPMGWMSWGYYRCNIDCAARPRMCLDESVIMRVADAFYKEGYQDAGYEYIIIDDCWSEKRRTKGRLVADKKRFPHGMKFLADYIHSKGLKFGMYLNLAEVTCMGVYPGSKGHLRDDALSLAAWDVDYVKVDGCFNEVDYLNEAYVELGQELRNTNRSIVYSCSWPYYMHFIHNVQVNFTSVMNNCNLWRNYEDINLPGTWSHAKQTIRYFQRSYYAISKYHGPGHWNDPDMLLVATGNLTMKQSRLQMAVYAMMSLPLLISCDMKKITREEKELLLNPDLLALNQDSLGVMARPYTINKDVTLWVKQHLPIKSDKYYSFSFAIVNFGQTANSALVVPRDYGLQNDAGYTVLDVFVGQYLRNTTSDAEFLIHVPAEDVVIYTMYPI